MIHWGINFELIHKFSLEENDNKIGSNAVKWQCDKSSMKIYYEW